jgi:GNAT superfamily N-acetyltransferase
VLGGWRDVHDLNVRRAARNDDVLIAALAGELGYPATADEMRSRLDALPATEAVFVAVDPNVIAWIQVGITVALESGAFAEIRGLVVNEAHRSRGIGAVLVAAAEEWASAQGMVRMRVRSNVVRERTHRFYERRGYVVKKSQKSFEKRLD